MKIYPTVRRIFAGLLPVRWHRPGTVAVEPLMAALDDKDSVVRLRAAWALGRIGDDRAVKKLISTLHDGDWSVRMRAADALGVIGAHEANEALLLLLQG